MNKVDTNRPHKVAWIVIYVLSALFTFFVLLFYESESQISIILLVVCLLIWIMLLLLKLIFVKNIITQYKNLIAESKSNVRIRKGKYVQVMELTNKMNSTTSDVEGEFYLKSTAGVGTNSFINLAGTPRMQENYQTSIELVLSLAESYEEAQSELNSLIKEYNTYISSFPTCIYARCLLAKKEQFVDNQNLQKSTLISDTIDSKEDL